MPQMKISLSIIACILTLFVNGQETTTFNVTLKGWNGDGRQIPLMLDTVFLNESRNKTGKIYTNVTSWDSSFVIPGVPVGKYWLQFSNQHFIVFPFPIVVCSRCDNSFPLIASPKEPGIDNTVFQMIEVSPGYNGDRKALSKDFQRSLSKAEKKKLKQSGDFTVHFYLTKQGAISDPSFVPVDLPTEIKNIVNKGLETVKDWMPAQRNGWVVDFDYTLDKATLLNK
jgi:hypothetical protein